MDYSFLPKRPFGRINRIMTINNTVDAGTSGGDGLKTISVNGIAMPICPYFMMNFWINPRSTDPSSAPV